MIIKFMSGDEELFALLVEKEFQSSFEELMFGLKKEYLFECRNKIFGNICFYEVSSLSKERVEACLYYMKRNTTHKVWAYFRGEGWDEHFFIINAGMLTCKSIDPQGDTDLMPLIYDWWHKDLGDIKIGCEWESSKEELTPEAIDKLRKEVSHYDSNGNVIDDPTKLLADLNGDFSGKEIAAPYPSKIWNWYIPAFESCAREMINRSGFVPNNGIAYRRSYRLNGYLGYVWSFAQGNVEHLLVLRLRSRALGTNSGFFVEIQPGMSLDEAIVAAALVDGIYMPPEWIRYPKIVTIEDLDEVDEGLNMSYPEYFNGRIVSWKGNLKQSKEGYVFVDEKNSEHQILDKSLKNKIASASEKFKIALSDKVSVRVLIQTNSEYELLEVLAAEIYSEKGSSIGGWNTIGESP
ncbi:hypothetical protein QWY82_07375 [Simiduia curdlanivorans]|uniref:Uncharacterized protein n=1 Tax=Simiduia curdlanivorans TaxID=1492769 RepID=A0ABV8V753_9GAMM|nr:hypothetical protein [Simiduia curdlanivorans]MDN3638622.1 hypothetical protein [Simiduia curdlanivorans]